VLSPAPHIWQICCIVAKAGCKDCFAGVALPKIGAWRCLLAKNLTHRSAVTGGVPCLLAGDGRWMVEFRLEA